MRTVRKDFATWPCPWCGSVAKELRALPGHDDLRWCCLGCDLVLEPSIRTVTLRDQGSDEHGSDPASMD